MIVQMAAFPGVRNAAVLPLYSTTGHLCKELAMPPECIKTHQVGSSCSNVPLQGVALAEDIKDQVHTACPHVSLNEGQLLLIGHGKNVRQQLHWNAGWRVIGQLEIYTTKVLAGRFRTCRHKCNCKPQTSTLQVSCQPLDAKFASVCCEGQTCIPVGARRTPLPRNSCSTWPENY